MNKYSPRLKIHFLVRLILIILAAFTFAPLMLLSPGVGTVELFGFEYNLIEYPWLPWVGSIFMGAVGISSILILKNTARSLSLLGLSFALGPVVNFLHPHSTLRDLTQIIIFTIIISGWLIIYDLKRTNITRH